MRRKKNITFTLAELAEKLDGTPVDCPDASQVSLGGLSTLSDAVASEISFVGDEKYIADAEKSKAGAFLVADGLRVAGRPCLEVAHVWKAVLAAFDIWYPDERPEPGIHVSAVVDASAQIDPSASVGPLTVIEAGATIGADAQIGAQCFIGRDARIGDGSLLHPGVRVLERVELGRQVILHSGVVLGADGFGYEVIGQRAVKIPQVGTVVLEDAVEIGANTCIDRAFLRETRIGAGTKIDNLVQIAHNVQIGRSCGLASQVGVAGSTVVGDGVIMWGQVGVPDHVRIGHGAVLLAKAGIKRDIRDGEQVFGTPAVPARDFGRQHAALVRMPAALKRLRALEKRTKELEAALASEGEK